MENDNYKSLHKNQSLNLFTDADGIINLLKYIGDCELKLMPVDNETAAILGRTISWSAIGAGITYLTTTSAPVPFEVRMGAVVAGALIGAGVGYFTATHKIRIVRINPGDSTPVFSVVIDPC